MADFDLDGILEPFNSEESIVLPNSFYHGAIATVLYELTSAVELSAQAFFAPNGFGNDGEFGNSLTIYTMGLNYRFKD